MRNKPTPRNDAGSTHVQTAAPLHRTTPDHAGDGDDRASAWTRFWFTPADPAGLHAVRVLAGLLFLFWLLPFAGNVETFFSFKGWFDREAYLEMSRLPPEQRPVLGWSILYAVGDNVGMVQAVYWGTISVLALFTLGIAPRITALLTFVLIASFVSFLDGPVGGSEDGLFVMLAFYLMVGYLLLGQFSQDLTPVERIIGGTVGPFFGKANTEDGKSSAMPSYAANLALRLFQVNFAIVVLTTCMHKLQIGDWWSGVAFWYPLHPPFTTTPANIHKAAEHAMSLLFIYSLTQYLFLAWQLSFPLWAWRQGRFARVLLIGGGLVGFIGALWIYKMPAYGAFYLVGCLAFLTAQEWRKLAAWPGKIWQKDSAAEQDAPAPSRAAISV